MDWIRQRMNQLNIKFICTKINNTFLLCNPHHRINECEIVIINQVLIETREISYYPRCLSESQRRRD